MRFISRGALAASVAAFALSVVAVASASAALPEFVPDGGAKFPIAASGSVTIGTEEKEIELNVPAQKFFECKGAKVSDEVTAAKTVAVTTDLEKCHERAGVSHTCTSTGAASGVIVLSGNGSLVYLEKTTKKVGVLLPVGDVEITCKESTGGTYFITGSVLSPITPVNTETTKYELAYHAKSAGVEEYTAYENETGKLVETKFDLGGASWTEPLSLEIKPKIKLTATHAFTISA